MSFIRHAINPLAVLCLALSGLLVPKAGAAALPNIVVILADDLGLGDVSHHVRAFQKKAPVLETPHIDKLAAEGMWFTDAHSSTALCSPTRYCVMSGNYNFRSYAPWGVWCTFYESPITRRDATLGRIAQKAGYATGFIGKWHLGAA